MAKPISLKRIQINKANTMMVASVAIAAFILVFSLVASRALWSKRGFQDRLISGKETAKAQLKQNLDNIGQLQTAYAAFVGTSENVIGGNPGGTGPKDGDNAKIVLDALPSKYDFPALASSLEKILKSSNYTIDGINGADDEVAQSIPTGGTPQPVEMPFEMSASSSIKDIDGLLSVLDRSIRPIHVNTLALSGTNNDLQLSISARTYYQPEKTVSVQKQVVK